MERIMNFESLYKGLYESLKGIPGLTKMYIGKASDISEPTNRHKGEGFPYTVEVAHGDIQTITDGEIFLIKKFKDSDLNCVNKNEGGGSNRATMLYVSYDCETNYKSNDDLDDDELDWVAVELKK